MFLRRVSGVFAVPLRGVTLPEDMVRWEANRAYNEWL
jgi:hypothetical protein